MNTNMQKVIRHILYLNGMAEAFDSADDFHLRLENDPWLALVIERHGDEVSITHYVDHNGDQLRDPEMVFSLESWAALSGGFFKGWVPKSTEPGGFGRVYRSGELRHSGDEPPKLLYYPKRMKEAQHFATLWAKNIRAQGFIQQYEASNIKSLTHPEQLEMALATTEIPIPIKHSVEKCQDASELHTYGFPEDLPSKLVTLAYKQAEAQLKADWPTAGDAYGYAVFGRGYRLSTTPLPTCTCKASDVDLPEA